MRPVVSEDAEPVPTRILEDVAEAGRDFEGPAVGLPASLPHRFHHGHEVIDDVERHATRSGTMVCQEDQGSVTQAYRHDVGPHLLQIEDNFPAQDVSVVRRVPGGVGRPDVEVCESTEGSRERTFREGSARTNTGLGHEVSFPLNPSSEFMLSCPASGNADAPGRAGFRAMT
jgi:hypothetical protein